MIWPQLNISYLSLLALALVPIIWWVSRLVPMSPKRIIFPATRFLRNLMSERQAAKNAPIWLKILRAAGLILIILAVSNPIIRLKNQSTEAFPNKFIFVIEDSYSAAPDYDTRQSQLKSIFESLKANLKSDSQFYVIATSAKEPSENGNHPEPMDIDTAAARAQSLKPIPIFNEHYNTALALEHFVGKAKIYYFADGLEHKNSDRLLNAMRQKSIGQISIYSPEINRNAALSEVSRTSSGFDFKFISADPSIPVTLDFYSANNLVLASANGARGSGSVNLDPATARKIAYTKISGVNSAAAVFLFDSFDKRPIIGVEKPSQSEQPILSDNHYIKAAAKQFADVYEDEIGSLVKAQTGAIIIGDRAGFSASETDALVKYIKQGGMLVRYIGPQAIGANDELLPAKFKSEPRNIKEAFNIKPLTILPFDRQSPLFGLELPSDANPIMVALLADSEDPPAIWTRLSDGTPFITAKKLGQGEIVAIHTSAAPYWSDIAFSGLQVGILKRIASRAQSPILPNSIRPTNLPLNPHIVLDGFGDITKATLDAKAIRIAPNQTAKASANLWPGIYENIETRLIVQGFDRETASYPSKISAQILRKFTVPQIRIFVCNLFFWCLVLLFFLSMD